jgi:hypothetical protein
MHTCPHAAHGSPASGLFGFANGHSRHVVVHSGDGAHVPEREHQPQRRPSSEQAQTSVAELHSSSASAPPLSASANASTAAAP